MKKFLFIVMAMCLTGVAKAQLYGSDVYYYVPAGESITDQTIVIPVYFNGDNIIFCYHFDDNNYNYRRSHIIKHLNEDSRYFIDKLKLWSENPSNSKYYEYNSSLSTTTREVYEKKWIGNTPHTYSTGPVGGPPTKWGVYYDNLGYMYAGFSKDKNSLIIWRERKSTGSIENKKYYKRVDVKDLMPKAANRDFLYE